MKLIPQLGTVAPVCIGCVSKVGKPSGFTITTTTTTFNLGPTTGSHGIQKATICTTCGKAFSDYEKTGRLGCGDCYKIFEKELESVLRRIHG